MTEQGEVTTTRVVLNSFVLETAIARFAYTPVFDAEASADEQNEPGLDDLAVRKDLTVELRLIDGEWCVDPIQLDFGVVSAEGSVSDEQLIEIALRASALSACRKRR